MTPVRTCVGCGERAEKRTMHRLVRCAGRLELDCAQRLMGRGAYLHPARTCIERFTKARGAIRSLRWAPRPEERTRVGEALLIDEMSR